ncbi:MAG: hypothetical protein QOF41_2785 [Methylobacteriaceae bacterium]|nr:hypothetical protein [Methylobacteriaceae bacterium]
MAAEGNRGRLLTVLGLAGGLALVSASAPAQAQMWGGWWGGWRPAQPAPYAAPIPPRRVAGIVASEGYALNGAPRRDGDVIIADGVDGHGQHMRFVIDAYDGEVLRSRIAGPPRPPGLIGNGEAADAPQQAHVALAPNQPARASGLGAALRPGTGPLMGGAQPGLEPLHPLGKPKPAPKPKQTAAHTPAKPATTPVPPKAPSEAEKVTAPAPAATQEPASPAPAAEANAPMASPATPLAPDAIPASPPVPPARAAVEAKAPTPQPTPDIGPAVKKVDPAPTATVPVAPSAPDFTDESK